MSENEETLPFTRVEGAKQVLKKTNLKEEEEKGMTGKLDTKDVTSEERDTIHTDK
jgi:hypothetical protein